MTDNKKAEAMSFCPRKKGLEGAVPGLKYFLAWHVVDLGNDTCLEFFCQGQRIEAKYVRTGV